MARDINITLRDVTGKEFTFQKLSQLKDFCTKELQFWSVANEKLPENITVNQQFTKINHLQGLVTTFDSWKDTEPKWSDDEFNTNFGQLQSQHINQLRGDWIWHGHPFVPIWIDLHEKAQATADTFIFTVLNRPPNTFTNSVDHMKGHLLAYEFLLQDESEIAKRRSAEKRSLNQLRDQLIDKNNELISNFEEFQDRFSEWDTSTREASEKLYKIRERLAQRQIINQNRIFDRELNSWKENVQNLEKTYSDLLKLKKPAEYWNKAAKKYWWQGFCFSIVLVVLVAVGLVYFEGFFTSWLQGERTPLSLASIQGIILFGTLVTVYAFLLRVLSRLAFSSFHLMRDAEEREQLTYLYLALSEEAVVDEDSRQIVLQALFSRSETGLLAQEHGPAMPGISDVVGQASKLKS